MIAIRRRCMGCGKELSGEGEEVWLCDECEAEAWDEALEMLEREDVGKRRDGRTWPPCDALRDKLKGKCCGKFRMV